ncbi:hypothetical protein [Pseudaminobacter soli (ex Li et al. 2025)]|uniref:hypothetical protein n=1 Tax=Pseudaminobacter soli (ex Li et al. 2025) TaxID=1295366 RepID=UPI0011B1F8BB|nr:hypothetical protein [Mesorhizobium soli]
MPTHRVVNPSWTKWQCGRGGSADVFGIWLADRLVVFALRRVDWLSASLPEHTGECREDRQGKRLLRSSCDQPHWQHTEPQRGQPQPHLHGRTPHSFFSLVFSRRIWRRVSGNASRREAWDGETSYEKIAAPRQRLKSGAPKACEVLGWWLADKLNEANIETW